MSRHPQLAANNDPTFKAKARSTREIVRRVVVYLRPYPWMAVGTVTCALLATACGFAFPILTRRVIDDVIVAGRAEALTPVMLGLLGAFLLRDIFNSLRIRINNTFEQNVIYDMRRDVYARLQRLPVNYFDQRASGDLMTRVIEDVNSVERLLIDGTEQGTVALLSVIGVTAFLFHLNPTLALVAMIPLPLLAAGALWYTLTAHRRYRAQREASSAMNALLMDNLQGIRQIKAYGQQTHEDTRFAARADDMRRGMLGIMRVWAAYSPAMGFVSALGSVLVLWVGGALVIQGSMTLGQLVGFLFFLALFYEPIGRLHGLNQILQAARAAGERVFDILDTTAEAENAARTEQLGFPARASTPSPPSDGGEGRGEEALSPATPARRGHSHPLSPSLSPAPCGGEGEMSSPRSSVAERASHVALRGEVIYDGVSFSYGEARTVLQNISLHAQPGQMIALVGPTGAGKSTLVNLLPAFYEPTAGRITIDGQDIRRVTLDSLRAHISVVSQEPFLFNGTIRENILYGRLDASEPELFAAARAANCHDFINHLAHGYDSRVGERGVKLSVGEKQRVSIARALLKNAPLLILDEATASVDTATERLIQEALERLMAGRTSFVIAHRLSTILAADQILVLRHGEIVERGTHDQLLAQDGLYAKLARIQNTTFIEEGFERLSGE